MKEQSCKICGCTESQACPGSCSWVAPGVCSACYKSIPVAIAHDTGEKYEKDQVIIIAWDRKSGLMHSTSWGRTMEDKKQAAHGSEYLVRLMGGDLERQSIFEDELGLLNNKNNNDKNSKL